MLFMREPLLGKDIHNATPLKMVVAVENAISQK